MPKMTVKYSRLDFNQTVDDSMLRLMVKSGNALRTALTNQSKQRPDGLGGLDGAVDSSNLSGSMAILEQKPNMVAVGTNVRYARTLAEGLPDPAAKVEFIKKWIKRKKIEGMDARSLTEKLKEVGPIPNPFHKRAIEDFKKAFDGIVTEVRS